MDKLWYSWSQSEVNVRDRIPGDYPRYSEKSGYVWVAHSKRPHRNLQGTSGSHSPPVAHLWEQSGAIILVQYHNIKVVRSLKVVSGGLRRNVSGVM